MKKSIVIPDVTTEEGFNKIFYPPEINKLVKRKGVASIKIADLEMNVINCEFDNGGGVEIKNISNDEIITLSRKNLVNLLEAFEEAEMSYDRYINKQHDRHKTTPRKQPH